MARLRKVISHESGGTDEASGLSNTPLNSATPAPPHANRCIKSETGIAEWTFYATDDRARLPSGAVATPEKITLKMRFDDVTPDVAIGIIDYTWIGGFGPQYKALNIYLKTDGDVEIRDGTDSVLETITAPLTVDTWHEFAIWYDNQTDGNPGSLVLTLDGTKYTHTDVDLQPLNALSGPADATFPGWWTLGSDSTANIEHSHCEITLWDQVTADTDVADAYAVYGYRPGGTPTAKGDTPDTGGFTTGQVGEFPLSETNFAEYTTNNLEGVVEFDSTGGGPSTAGAPTETYIGASYFFWAERTNGSQPALNLLYGNDSESATAITAYDANADLLNATGSGNFITTESLTIIPTSSQDFEAGIGKTAGGRDIRLHDVYCSLVTEEPAAAVAFPPPFKRRSFQPHLSR